MVPKDAPKNPRRQQEVPGTEKPTDKELDEIAVPLMHMLHERGTMDDKIKDMRAQLFARCKEKQVVSYKVEDGPLEMTIAPTSTERLSVKLKVSEDDSSAAA